MTFFIQLHTVAHLNLREAHESYKYIIGQVILDVNVCHYSTNNQKNKNIKTVVNKLDSIDHTFRFFKMEILAGIDDMSATLV